MPSLRPSGPNAGTQNWRQLLFLHWTVPVEKMRARVPGGLELDLWQGEAYVGVVAFAMEKVRPAFLPRVLALDFLETNVRTYVRRNGEAGVYFFSLEAASRLAVAAARLTFGLPYHFARMKLTENGQGQFTYDTVRKRGGARLNARYSVGERFPAAPHGGALPGTLEEFLVERYVLFVERGGRMWRAQVHHEPYRLREARVDELNDGLVEAAGLPNVGGAATHVCYSEGVDVEVFAPRRV